MVATAPNHVSDDSLSYYSHTVALLSMQITVSAATGMTLKKEDSCVQKGGPGIKKEDIHEKSLGLGYHTHATEAETYLNNRIKFFIASMTVLSFRRIPVRVFHVFYAIRGGGEWR